MTANDHIVRIPDTVVFQELRGESVLLDLRSETYFGLDGVGTLLWQEWQRNPSLAAAEAVVQRTFAVNAEQVTRDVRHFVAELVRRQLVDVDPPLPPVPAAEAQASR